MRRLLGIALTVFFFSVVVFVRVEGAAEGKVCNMTSINDDGSQNIRIDGEFISNMRGCTELVGSQDKKGREYLLVRSDGVTQDMFNKVFGEVQKISNLYSLWIDQNDVLTDLVFPKLESIGTMEHINFAGCRNVTNISFPLLQDSSLDVTLHLEDMPAMKSTAAAQIQYQFAGECAFAVPISNVSQLSKCTKMQWLEFDRGMSGTINNPINFVRGDIKIKGTYLHDLNFLNLSTPAAKGGQCVITDNHFCEYSEDRLREMLTDNFPLCVIEGNKGGNCAATTTEFFSSTQKEDQLTTPVSEHVEAETYTAATTTEFFSSTQKEMSPEDQLTTPVSEHVEAETYTDHHPDWTKSLEPYKELIICGCVWLVLYVIGCLVLRYSKR